MERWEYLFLQLPGTPPEVQVKLNYYGEQGWELIGFESCRYYYFKRRKV